MKAVDAMLAKFGGTMSPGQIAANNAERMKGKEAEGIAFQIELDKVTSALGTELAPALKTLAPLAIDAAKGLAGIVSFGAQNPGIAITAAIVASIGKAAVGEAVGKAVGGMLANMTASSAGLGLLAAAAIAAAIAIADYQAKSDEAKGKASADPELIKKAEEQLRTKGTIDKETIDEIARKRAEVAGAQAALKTGGVDYQGLTAVVVAQATGGGSQIAAGEGTTLAAKEMGPEKLDALASKLDALIAAYGKTQRVYVENAADMKGAAPGPTPNEGARSGGVH
jgi:cell division protein ZapA (FtsZ GTPase activity inhibitor)